MCTVTPPPPALVLSALQKLDLPAEASFEEARTAHRELLQVWHPDRHSNNMRLQARATAKSQEINAAWDTVRAWHEQLRQGDVNRPAREQAEVQRRSRETAERERQAQAEDDGRARRAKEQAEQERYVRRQAEARASNSRDRVAPPQAAGLRGTQSAPNPGPPRPVNKLASDPSSMRRLLVALAGAIVVVLIAYAAWYPASRTAIVPSRVPVPESSTSQLKHTEFEGGWGPHEDAEPTTAPQSQPVPSTLPATLPAQSDAAQSAPAGDVVTGDPAQEPDTGDGRADPTAVDEPADRWLGTKPEGDISRVKPDPPVLVAKSDVGGVEDWEHRRAASAAAAIVKEEQRALLESFQARATQELLSCFHSELNPSRPRRNSLEVEVAFAVGGQLEIGTPTSYGTSEKFNACIQRRFGEIPRGGIMDGYLIPISMDIPP